MSILRETNSAKEIINHLCDDQWSNAACCDYAILTCENLGYPKEQIKLILRAMEDVFNNKTLEQSKQKYYRY